MPMLIPCIDEIARQKQCDVAFLTFEDIRYKSNQEVSGYGAMCLVSITGPAILVASRSSDN